MSTESPSPDPATAGAPDPVAAPASAEPVPAVPEAAPAVPAAPTYAAADPRSHDRFFVRQRVRMMVNQYEVTTLGEDGKSEGAPVCFVQQKRMRLKEDLRAYVDDRKEEEVFRIKALQVWDPRARYTVADASGQPIGELGKVFGKSLLRSTWKVFDAAGVEIAWAHERNLGVALFRRFASFVPFIGGLLDMIPLPYHFDYFANETPIGSLRRLISIRDRYVLDLSADAGHLLDRRVAVALAVGMDAMQAR